MIFEIIRGWGGGKLTGWGKNGPAYFFPGERGGSKTLALGFSMAPHLLRALVDFISTGLMIGIGQASI